MTRRSFLGMAAIGTAVAVTGGIVKWRFFASRRLALAFPLMLSAFCDEATLREVGRKYLAQVPGEDSTGVLLARIEAAGAPDGIEGVGEAASQAEQDFVKKKILVIDGWIISQTEARQCALLALS